MMRKNCLASSMLGFLLLAVSLLNFSNYAQAQNTILYVDPPRVMGLNVGDTFSINITISNVIDLYGWQFKLLYRNNALNASSIVEGPFLKKDGGSTFFWIADFTDNYNDTHGLIFAACSRSAMETGVNGDGVLATIVFKVKALLSTPLNLLETKLIDSASPFGNRIPHTTVDGEVYAGFHDVAVVNVSVSHTRVYKGQQVQINVTVKNNGDYPETFNVTTYYDDNAIETRTASGLAAGSNLTISFIWNTSNVEPDRTYAIKAQATSVPGETNLNNNLFTDGSVTISSYPTFLINIVNVVPCNQSGYPQTSFEVGTIAYFKVVVNSTSFNTEPILVTVNIFDSYNTTLGVVSFKGAILPGTSTFILGLPIPSSLSPGTAKVYANAYTDWPYYGGVNYCPEKSAEFEIVKP
ncbi:MAG: cohesin domain-containing protein [Candidatus Bathyarchaeia archaeon]